MRSGLARLAACCFAACLAVCLLATLRPAPAAAQTAAGAPAPLKRIDPDRLYAGTWYEAARRPMSITDGCVAGTTRYDRRPDGGIEVLDACRIGNPAGEAKTIGGPGTILDPGTNARLRVDYRLYGIVPISRDYWILDRAPDYSWFISADPTFRDLFIFVRDPGIRPAALRRLVARAAALGYDTRQLEYPEQPGR